MRIDWRVLARAAGELKQTLLGVRIGGSREIREGMALLLRARGGSACINLSVFSSPPILWLADEPIGPEPSGSIRALGNAASGLTITDVRCIENERILEFTLQRRSRFGVIDSSLLIVELIPRFGNVILCKDGIVVAALREFSLAQNPARAIEVGRAYAPPPALPLKAHASPEPPASESVLADFAAHMLGRDADRASQLMEALKSRLLKRVEGNLHTLQSERSAITARLLAAQARDTLREQGDAIYAGLYERAPEERDAAKEEAAALFATYRKLGNAVPGLQKRATFLDAAIEAAHIEAWEISRADAQALAEIATDAGERDANVLRARSAPRAPFEMRTISGSRILVGRSPKQNAELTFRVAKPDDLWFHAQRIPGAHVILSRDDRTDPPLDDIKYAAALAALHSKARHTTTVPVDYTRRKHVRKQKDAPPGLVWYTDFSTILAHPDDASSQTLA